MGIGAGRTNVQPGFDTPRRVAEPIERLSSIEGWIPSWADEAALVRASAAAGLNGVLLFNGSVKEDGRVVLDDAKGLQAGVAAADKAGIASWLTVTNHGADMSGALGEGRTGAHVDSLLAAWRESGCGHLDLDYETLTLSQIRALEGMVTRITDVLPAGARLSLTLQPADKTLRPDQWPVYRRLLANRGVTCLRLMAYDYHWRNSLPGALCPVSVFARLIDAYPEYRSKLVMCLPLYGYDWPRPLDGTLPAAQSITLRDLPLLQGRKDLRASWMEEDAELAIEYTTDMPHAVAAPSLRAVRERVKMMLDAGVPNLCFWHLGCSELGPVAQAAREPNRDQRETFKPDNAPSWRDWQIEFRRSACRTVIAQPGDTLESIGKAAGVDRTVMLRFNEELGNEGIAGKTVFVPK